jgi:hypothetical protein
MKPKLLLLIFLFPVALKAQTKLVVNIDKDASLKERYYVLKGDNKIREGKYEASLGYYNFLVSEGLYHNNLKDSIWKYYAFNNILLLEGAYAVGKKIGVWKAYNKRQQVQVEYDYTAGKLLFFKPSLTDSTRQYNVINGVDTITTLLDRPPVFLEGNALLYSTLTRTVKYPPNTRLSGDVIISVTIDAAGKVLGHRTKSHLGGGLDEEALLAVKAIEGDWLPGILNGKPVTAEYDVVVTFNRVPDIMINSR